jgi:hypothetical protein
MKVKLGAIMLLEGSSKLNKCNDLIGSRTCDLPACDIAPQPTTLPCAIVNFLDHMKNYQP